MILYVTEPNALVKKRGERVIVSRGDEAVAEVPALHLTQVVVIGNATITAPALAFFTERGVDVVFLSAHGTYRGRIVSRAGTDATLRLAQYSRFQDPPFALEVSRSLVAGKIANCRQVLVRSGRAAPAIRETARALERGLGAVSRAATLDAVRGHEGSAAAAYYAALPALLADDFGFEGRQKRPPPDPVNAMLSFGYTLLYGTMLGLAFGAGLDPYLGVFHAPAPGHAALASDLIEEFRPVLVDRLVVDLVNHRAVTRRDFAGEGRRITMSQTARRAFLRAFDERLFARVVHPRSGDRLSYLQCMAEQPRLLARVLRGEAAAYEPFTLR